MDRGVLLCQCTERERLARIEAEQVRQGAQLDLLVHLAHKQCLASKRTVREQVPGVTALVAAIAALIRTFGAP